MRVVFISDDLIFALLWFLVPMKFVFMAFYSGATALFLDVSGYFIFVTKGRN